MRIAHLLPASAVFPLVKHNGRYEWALRLAREQAARGHEVAIFAGEGSHDASAVIWRSVSTTETDRKQRNLALLRAAFEDESFDIYHSHFDTLHYAAADLTDKPVIVTQHWFPQPAFSRDVQLNTHRNVVAVPVTHHMAREDAKLNIPAAHPIYHGVDVSLFQFSPMPSERLLFVGRIHPNKGVDDAIRYALQAGASLDIIGKVNQSERDFWDELQPLIDGSQIRYLGQQPLETVAKAYQNAKALIFPSRYAEAFGQVTIEAQASGTPVIISNVGASSELVQHAVTGFICQTDEEFIQAIKVVDTLNRAQCRTFAERFDKSTMIDAYEQLYLQALSSIESVLS